MIISKPGGRHSAKHGHILLERRIQFNNNFGLINELSKADSRRCYDLYISSPTKIIDVVMLHSD